MQKVDRPTSLTKLNDNCGLPDLSTDYQIRHLGNPSGLPEIWLKIDPCIGMGPYLIIPRKNPAIYWSRRPTREVWSLWPNNTGDPKIMGGGNKSYSLPIFLLNWYENVPLIFLLEN